MKQQLAQTVDWAVDAAALSPLDLAYGVPLGQDPSVTAEPFEAATKDPRGALDAVVRLALMRPPCLVSFSGGRDSSALLAVAARIARQEGFPLPVPATLVFPGDSDADEEDWQRLVLKHLSLPEWHRIDVAAGMLDAVGPVAATAFRRHGQLWPFNAHFHLPIIEASLGGSVITGFGGDEVGRSSATARAEQVLSGRRRPIPADGLVVGLALSPLFIRRSVHRRRVFRDVAALPWLTTLGRRTVTRAVADDAASIPFGWHRVLQQRIRRDRYFRICRRSFDVMGAPSQTRVFHPFVEDGVVAALASVGGVGGLGTRTAMMQRFFSDVLPPAILERRSKATFSDPLWTEASQTFAAEWAGAHMDSDLIDPSRAGEHWRGGAPNLLSVPLFQRVWLAEQRWPG